MHTIAAVSITFMLWISLTGCDLGSGPSLAEIDSDTASQLVFETGLVKVGAQTFRVELADDALKRQIGLMFRDGLEPGTGMLFLGFGQSRRWPIWMKNTLIPLDIVWITEDLRIAGIHTAPPCKQDPCPTYVPRNPASYVLEVNAGEFKGRIGQRVEISAPKVQSTPAATATRPANR